MVAKLESVNPGGSKKDRVALKIVLAARRSGKLKDGQAVVEVTSGNTGAGLALVCQALGHPFYAVMSAGNTKERAQMMRALGGQVVLVEQVAGGVPGKVSGEDMRRVKARAVELVREKNAFFSDQFENEANAAAHEEGTAVELWEQCEGRLDAIVAFVGSGGALGGMARYLLRKNSRLHVYLVEPAEAASLATCCCCDTAHSLQGGGYGKDRLSMMRDVPITRYLRSTDQQATDGARMLAREEGILAGYSTGAQLMATIDLLRGDERGKTVAFLVCDSGMKYFSTNLYP
jgi:cysteine synthase A